MRYSLLIRLLRVFALLTLIIGGVRVLNALTFQFRTGSEPPVAIILSIFDPLVSSAALSLLMFAAAAILETIERNRAVRSRPIAASASPASPRYKHEPYPTVFDEERALQQAQRDFEREVAQLIMKMSGYSTEMIEGDRGAVSVKIYDAKGLIGIAMCIYAMPDQILKSELIHDLEAAKRRLAVPVAYLVTTGRFSPQATRVAFNAGVRLIDGEQFALMRQNGRVSA